jgi:pyruvate kinase
VRIPSASSKSVRPRSARSKDVSDDLGQAAADLLPEMEELRRRLGEVGLRFAAQLDQIAFDRRPSALNLLHYLVLRNRDVRSLQSRLASVGLSSLGRSEAHVQATVDAVCAILCRLRSPGAEPKKRATPTPRMVRPPVSFAEGDSRLAIQAEAILGAAPAARRVRIMVTMPAEAAEDARLIPELLRHGMNVMRINCAHDGPAVWRRMIGHLARARRAQGRPCRVLMDLGGPKLRTGPMAGGAPVLKWRPHRDAYGKVLAPARVWLCSRLSAHAAPAEAEAVLPLSPGWLKARAPGDVVTFDDLRGRSRSLRVTERCRDGLWAEAAETAYLGPETRLAVGGPRRRGERRGHIDGLPAHEQPLELRVGDRLLLTRTLAPGCPARRGPAGKLLSPGRIGCTLSEVFDHCRRGQSIWFDDGKIGGRIDAVGVDALTIAITQTSKPEVVLGADKGINLPDTDLPISALTPKDLEDLRFAAKHADAVGLSFVRQAEDVVQLDAQLRRAGASPKVGIVLKIETRQGFENLPKLMLAGLGQRPLGVMIARGDLAIECGYERMAEIQEEILWLCEAAHLPTIWATQVLETLTKKGMPSRAEITDAAMGQRAECVMLNKGPHVVEAVRVLGDLMARMQENQHKKSPTMRLLNVSRLIESGP